MSTRDLETSDIVLAAVLRHRGYSLDRIEKIGNRGIFFFSRVSLEFLTDFDLGRCLVEPIAFNQAIKALTVATRRIT